MKANATSLKAKIKNLAKKRNIKAQVLLQNYMFECFLERLSLSEYKDKFIIKGGMLVAAIVGMDIRSTMDLDATIRGLPLTEESIFRIITAICDFPVDDGVTQKVGAVSAIRPDDEYGGYRVKITAFYDTIEVPFTVDITTNDIITPKAVKFTLRGIFNEDKQIELWAYNIETIMAEKIETILRRNTLNTRPRDFYDIFILSTSRKYDSEVLKEAISATAKHRGTTEQISDVKKQLTIIKNSPALRQLWDKYRQEFTYAKDITFDDTVKVLYELLNVQKPPKSSGS